MSIPQYNESTVAYVDFEVYNKDEELTAPTTLAYQIDCATTGAAIRASTALTPASTGTITLTPTDTALQSQNNATELRVLTLTANAGLDSQHIEIFQYEVLNLKAVT